MSQENVELVRGIWRTFGRAEFPADAFADEVTWHTATDLPDQETCVGSGAIRSMLARGWENVTEPQLEVEELRDAGDVVLVRWQGSGIGRASGLPIAWHETHAYRINGGKVIEVREYRSWEQACRAVGLAE